MLKHPLFEDNPIFANPNLQITRVKGDGIQTEIREEGEVGNRERSWGSAKSSREKTPPTEGRRQSGPAPEKTGLSRGRSGGKGGGGRLFSEAEAARGEQQAQLQKDLQEEGVVGI